MTNVDQGLIKVEWGI